MVQHNKNMSRRAFITSAGVGSGALIYYPINVLGQQGSVYLDIEAYDTINSIRASAKQEFALLCLNPSPDDQIDTSAEVLEVLQSEIDSIISEIEIREVIHEEKWTRTNLSPAPFTDYIPLRNIEEIDQLLPTSTMHPCKQAVIRVLADVFNISEDIYEEFENFLSSQEQAIYVEGMAASLEQEDNSQLRNYVELLVNGLTINESIKQAIETSQSPVARALLTWLLMRSIPFVGLCLAIMDIGISLIRQRGEILSCANSIRS